MRSAVLITPDGSCRRCCEIRSELGIGPSTGTDALYRYLARNMGYVVARRGSAQEWQITYAPDAVSPASFARLQAVEDLPGAGTVTAEYFFHGWQLRSLDRSSRHDAIALPHVGHGMGLLATPATPALASDVVVPFAPRLRRRLRLYDAGGDCQPELG
ncbi:MAG: hypothetical protein R3D27_08960 [Hyphomicrobiaceae bacterium]